MTRKNKFRKKSNVCVTNNIHLYRYHSEMAKQLKATNWVADKAIKNDALVAVVNFGFDRVMGSFIYLVKDSEGGEYLIEEKGLTGGWFSIELQKMRRKDWMKSVGMGELDEE